MDVREVLPPDAIPSVDDPTFTDEYDGDPDEEAIVLDFDGEPARAYPLRTLHYHEIVNDRVGGRPVAVTWCPLCASAVVYEARVDGRELTFGVSGKLADDDLVMYDRETGSEWKQSLGECIAGELEGETLAVLPASVTPLERFDRDHDGVVLVPPGGESEASGPGPEMEPIAYDAAPYERYFESEGFGLAAHRGDGSREWDREDLAPKEVVLGIERGGEALGVVRSRLTSRDEMATSETADQPTDTPRDGVATVTVGGDAIVVFATPEGMFAFENPGIEFDPTTEPGVFIGDGTRWDGVNGESDDGRTLSRVPTRRLFAFAWQDDHGPDAFYGG